MPDIMLLPQIASALGVTIEDVYDIQRKPAAAKVAADDFPAFCHDTLHEKFFYHAKTRFTQIDPSDAAQLAYQKESLKDGFRIGCLSNTKGAFVLTEDFAFVDCCYKDKSEEDVMCLAEDAEFALMYLSNPEVRAVLRYQYLTAIEKSKENNCEFTLEEIICATGLDEKHVRNALLLLTQIRLNVTYTDHITKERRYVLRYTTAVYAMAIYKLAAMLTEDDNWHVVRDTSMISDYAFCK